MLRRPRHEADPRRAPSRRRLAAGLLGLVMSASAASQAAQEPAPNNVAATVDRLAKRLEDLEKRNSQLAEQNQSLTKRVDELNRRLEQVAPDDETSTPTASPIPPPTLPSPSLPGLDDELDADAGVGDPPPRPTDVSRLFAESSTRRYQVGEHDDDAGNYILVHPNDAQRMPFELRFDIFTQARYTNFARGRDFWVDAEGDREPINSFASFEVARNFLVFSGFGIDPKLQYTAIIFSSTSINDTVYLGWINYRFSRAFDLRFGNWLLPGTREWYESFRWTLGSDRLMATTFFRPNISPGVWIQGEPIDGLNYVAMVANSLSRFTQGVANRVGSSLAFGGTVWWEPTHDYGVGVSDVEYHDERSFRFGTSVDIAHESNQGFTLASIRNPEDTLIRLSDGTPLFRPGVLAPGVELESTNLQLWTIDAAMKCRGLGISGEYFFRWLDGFQTVGGRSPYSSLFDTGGLLQAGYFLQPHKLEAFARTSFVTGHFGGGYEYGGGLNWYPRGVRSWRTTFEILRINGSPAQNFITGYRAGETGTLFQLQWLTDF
ncbi:bZIP transcription factor [Paludisphaera rhizosphaerae]|uniref:bZIP transcription factor n=1 Tax=Paludisphaera rhizosphaerae TaxID=2711216 RepID=UPI0013EC3DDE|nr:bZIP transcription factor [Paludisphaera rhizosphaerae]